MVNNRAEKAIRLLEKHGINAMLFTDMHNIRYLTGFTGSDAVLLVAASTSLFLTDSRYVTQAAEQVDCPVRVYTQKWAGVAGAIKDLGASSVGFESGVLTVADLGLLQNNLASASTLVPVADSAEIRGVKDETEIALIEQAASLAADALESVLPSVTIGASEQDIAREIEFAARRLGASGNAFDFIVASGPRGALPHGIASEKQLASGEMLTIDYGICRQGYNSDETVNFALGTVPDTLHSVYDIVLEAHDLAIAAVAPGIALKQIDKVARDFIGNKGYGSNFGHGLGHGVGLEIHEYPRVSPQSAAVAEVGMVFTIEPGIYIPGLGGVRIEDIVVVTDDGCRTLTRLPKELRTLSH